MSAFADWRRRRAARQALRSGDAWVCPYCRTVHPEYDVGGTKLAFGYPSVKFRCCGKVAFMLKDPKTGELMSFTRIGNGVTDWMPAEAYFAWVEESAKARGRRETTPHQFIKEGAEGSQRAGKLQLTPKAETVEAATPPAAPAAPAKPVAFIAVAKLEELKDNAGKVVTVNGRRIALFRQGDQVRAIADTCAHSGRSLGESAFEDGIVTCQGHGWRYDVATGRTEHNPDLGVARFDVKVEGGVVHVAA